MAKKKPKEEMAVEPVVDVPIPDAPSDPQPSAVDKPSCHRCLMRRCRLHSV